MKKIWILMMIFGIFSSILGGTYLLLTLIAFDKKIEILLLKEAYATLFGLLMIIVSLKKIKKTAKPNFDHLLPREYRGGKL